AVSSLAAVLGGIGYAAYAAANLFVDAFVDDRSRDGEESWLGIQWDAWSLDDAPLGEGQVTALSAGLARLAVTPADGGEALRRRLAAATAELVTLSTADLEQRMAQALTRAAAREVATTAERHARPALPTPYVAPETELEAAIAEVWQRTFGF